MVPQRRGCLFECDLGAEDSKWSEGLNINPFERTPKKHASKYETSNAFFYKRSEPKSDTHKASKALAWNCYTNTRNFLLTFL